MINLTSLLSHNNPYTILELNQQGQSSSNDIKNAFKRLILRYHPDKARSQEQKMKGIQIIEAYKLLSDQDKRKKFDKQLKINKQKIKCYEDRYYQTVKFDQNKDNQQHNNEKFNKIDFLQCQQCWGETSIPQQFLEASNRQQNIYINCSHCGIIIRIQ